MNNPLFKVLKIDKVYSEFDQKVEKIGWLNGCKWLLKKLKINYNKIDTSSAALVVYANHPTGLDPYLLTAALGRSDSYYWGDLYQAKKGKNIATHIIPIAPKPFWSILRRPLTNWPGYIYMRLTTPSLSKEKTKNINKKSINKTISLLKKGKLVIIFPSGGEYEWLPKAQGLKKVLKICSEERIKLNVIKLKIKNFGELRLLFHFFFRTKIKAKIVQD